MPALPSKTTLGAPPGAVSDAAVDSPTAASDAAAPPVSSHAGDAGQADAQGDAQGDAATAVGAATLFTGHLGFRSLSSGYMVTLSGNSW
jgi:hypothetical protein